MTEQSPKERLQRLEKIRLVINERELLSNCAQELLSLLRDSSSERLKINQKVIELSAHLGNMAGFCDKNSKNWVTRVSHLLGTIILQSDRFAFRNPLLPGLLPEIVAIQVDFSKRPFKVVNVGLMLKEFEARLRLER